jgi:hypothetical protein
VVLDRLRREPTLRLQGYVGIDRLRASLELGEAVVAEEGEQVAIEHVAIVLDGRRLEVPPRQVVADEAVGEVGKRDAVGLAEALVDGGESLAELALRHALGPLRSGPSVSSTCLPAASRYLIRQTAPRLPS